MIFLYFIKYDSIKVVINLTWRWIMAKRYIAYVSTYTRSNDKGIRIYDVDIETATKRVGKDKDRMEQAGKDFQIKVQNGYKQIALSEPDRVKIVDSTDSIENVFEKTKMIVEQLLKKGYN